MRMVVKILHVVNYGKRRICTLQFKGETFPTVGQILKGQNGLIVKIRGIVINKKMVEGIIEHPNLSNVFDCELDLLSSDDSWLKEGGALFG